MAAKAVFAREHRAGCYSEPGLALVDLPGSEEGCVPELLLIQRIAGAGLDLMLPEAEAGIHRRRGIECAGRRVKAIVYGVTGVAFLPAENERREVEVRQAAVLSAGVKGVRREPGVDHGKMTDIP
jgi:hypothetical protein